MGIQNQFENWEQSNETVTEEILNLILKDPLFLSEVPLPEFELVIQKRKQWLKNSKSHINTAIEFIHALLQFEHSREGKSWNFGII